MKTSKLAGLYALLAIALLGSACTPTAAPTPTVDPNVIYTSAAQTVIAQLTQNAPPPTATLAPTLPPPPTATLMALPTLAPIGTLSPLKTPTMALAATNDKCQYITQTPADYSSVKGGSTFNITWRIKNTGSTTWNTNYVYRFYAAQNKLKINNSSYPLSGTVLPNGEVELKAQATASTTAGAYDAQWVLTNPEGTNFCNFSIFVNVTAASSASSGDSPTAAPAEAHWITIDNPTSPHVYNGKMTQVRLTYPRNAVIPEGTYIHISVNGGPEVNGDEHYSSTTKGTILGSFTHVDTEIYNIVITVDAAGEPATRLEICDSDKTCW